MTSRALTPPATAVVFHHRRQSHLLLFAAAAAFPSLILLLILLFLYLYFSHCRSPSTPFDPPLPSHLRRFSYQELHSATSGFDASRSLGRGASTVVFLGILADGKSVAVKRVDPPPKPPALSSVDREFLNELQVLSNLRQSPFVVSLLGYCLEGNHRRLIVYEYMSNGSLQAVLFGPRRQHIDWNRRFQIILHLAKALSFLHLNCDPAVIHGDIKPSNVLLGPDFQAKISDFGLSRLKTETTASAAAELFSQELFSGSHQQVDINLAIRPSSSSNHEKKVNAIGISDSAVASPLGEQPTANPYEDELDQNSPLDDGNIDASRIWEKEWWWKQDESSELSSRDYVREWIGSQICPEKNPDWEDDHQSSLEEGTLDEAIYGDSGLGALGWNQDKSHNVKVGDGYNKRERKMREWWKEEYFAEISKKGKSNKGLKCFKTTDRRHRDESSSCNGYNNHNRGDGELNVDLSYRKGWKKKKKKKRKSRSVSNEMSSGDLFSKELSRTTSMRGTVCYIAPEHGCGGHLMEKAVIYSFGVLILVIVSGRRPLHVLQSPMKLDRANLISWCRKLAQAGNVLDIVDEKLKNSYNKDQVSLSINLALLCLQRIPDLRPDSWDMVKILEGEMELPFVPFDSSPSPTTKL